MLTDSVKKFYLLATVEGDRLWFSGYHSSIKLVDSYNKAYPFSNRETAITVSSMFYPDLRLEVVGVKVRVDKDFPSRLNIVDFL